MFSDVLHQTVQSDECSCPADSGTENTNTQVPNIALTSGMRNERGVLLLWAGNSWSPAVDDDGVFGPVRLLPDDVDELQNAVDGVDSGDAVVRPGGVVQMDDVLSLVCLQGAINTKMRRLTDPFGFRPERNSHNPDGTS